MHQKSINELIKVLAKFRNISLNKLYEEFTISALAEFDAESLFEAMATRSSLQRGKEFVDKLQIHYDDNI